MVRSDPPTTAMGRFGATSVFRCTAHAISFRISAKVFQAIPIASPEFSVMTFTLADQSLFLAIAVKSIRIYEELVCCSGKNCTIYTEGT